MKIDLEKLKELSNLVKEDCSTDLNEYIFLCKVNVVKDKPPVEVDRSWARFVKAANPQTILKLIELIEVYEGVIKYTLGPTRDVKTPVLRQALEQRKRILGE